MSLSDPDDPTDFEGTYPHSGDSYILNRKNPRSNAATGASAAGVRALSAQIVAFYFRAPVKAFFRTRVDYLHVQAFAKAINPRTNSKQWSWHTTTPGLLTHAVRTYGWGFIPNQVLPPLLANVGVGAILYTSYLQVLGSLHDPSSHSAKRVYPPPPPGTTFAAGLAAGGLQSIVAAPLDALQVRFNTSEMLEGQYKNMWHYGRHKLQEIGVRGIFAGWGISFLKDSLGSAVFFTTFEYVKAQAYYGFVARYYSAMHPDVLKRQLATSKEVHPVIKPHFALEPTFLMLAGVAASVTQQLVQHPLSLIQNLHYGRLESLDHKASLDHSRAQMMRHYYHAYGETLAQCKQQAIKAGGWKSWLYKGFIWNTLKQVPSTSAGLVIFELVRRRYGNDSEAVKIQREGYDILLS